MSVLEYVLAALFVAAGAGTQACIGIGMGLIAGPVLVVIDRSALWRMPSLRLPSSPRSPVMAAVHAGSLTCRARAQPRRHARPARTGRRSSPINRRSRALFRNPRRSRGPSSRRNRRQSRRRAAPRSIASPCPLPSLSASLPYALSSTQWFSALPDPVPSRKTMPDPPPRLMQSPRPALLRRTPAGNSVSTIRSTLSSVVQTSDGGPEEYLGCVHTIPSGRSPGRLTGPSGPIDQPLFARCA